ncbi:MAG: hypothetical protein EOO17_01655 [Chloroflexi bacterium]|nr:MAG: hypothetical protein EOO17_01655 [Chloroflexota bacterium]
MSKETFGANREVVQALQPKRVRDFGRECVLFAYRHDQLRRSPRNKQFRVGPISHYRAADVWSGEPFGSIYKETYAVFASTSGGDIDSMKIIHGLVVEDMGSNGGTLRQVYTFKAGEDGTSAMRKHSFGNDSYVKLDDLNLDNVYVPDDIAGRLAVEQEFATVNEGDFSLLAAEMREMMGRVDRGELSYSENEL